MINFKEHRISIAGKYVPPFFFFIIVLGLILNFGGYLLFFQESQSLFVYSREYISEFFLKPGGPLVLLGKFLTQFYYKAIPGAIIISSVLTLPYYLIYKINKKIAPGSSDFTFLALIPSCILLLMQIHYYHTLEYNLGYLVILAFFLFSLHVRKKNMHWAELIVFPFFYYLTGAYAFIYLGIYLVYNVLHEQDRKKYSYSILILLITVISVILFKELLFYQPLNQLLIYPLPVVSDDKHRILFYTITILLILYPAKWKILSSVKTDRIKTQIISIAFSIILIFTTLFLIKTIYNPQTVRVLQIEQLVFENKFDEAIDLQEQSPSKNMIGQYFYNIALSETDQLCDRLFKGRQDFGVRSLILPWSKEYLSWGAYFYYSVGLFNEAHRWAYEDIVVYGYRPQNLKLLIKTNLINGNYKISEKYLRIFKRTLYYRDWASEYEKFIVDTSLIRIDNEFNAKLKIVPKENFLIKLDDPQNNILLLLKGNPDNRKAFEYEMAWLLLSKNVEATVNNICKLKAMGYTHIPTCIEEAILSYENSTKALPDLGGLSVRQETLARFDKYVAAFIAARNNPGSGKALLEEKFGDTFWYYFHFK